MNLLDISYVELFYNIQLKRKCMLPRYKTSALRGTIGNALLYRYCIGNKDCKTCSFEQNCIVHNIFNPKSSIDVPFLSSKGTSSPGYVIECLDYRTEYSKGDILEFKITLFGRNIVYLSQFVYSFDNISYIGFGSTKESFRLLGVYNSTGLPIYENQYLYKENIVINNVLNYVNEREKTIHSIKKIQFITPFRLVHNNKLSNSTTFQDIIYALSRRLVILSSLENIHTRGIFVGEGKIISQKLNWIDIERFSTRQQEYLKLGGLVGEIEFSEEINQYLKYMIAGELIHLGKNTSFGLGKYRILE